MKIVTHERHGGHYRALEINGEQVSHLGIYDHTMRIGPAQFKMGGIGGVATVGKHRKKGYSRVVMEDAIRWMAEQGYDVTMLCGIDYFYEKFGFACCMQECVAKVRTRDAEAALAERHPFKTRPLQDRDWPSVIRLYNRNNACRTLSIVRNPKTFRRLRHGSGFRKEGECFVVEWRGGGFAGYAVMDSLPDSVTACEVETIEPAAYWAVFAELTRTAINRRDGEIAVQLPLDHPFMAFLRPFGCTVTLTYRNTGAIMGRFVNESATLATLAAAYERERGLRRRKDEHVTIKTDLGKTCVAFSGAPRSGKAHLAIPSTTLFQVIVGFRTPAEALLSPGVKASGGGEKVLGFLRAGQEPGMYSIDYF